VMDGVEHFSASIERVRINTRTELLNL
jgi:hypothetical protein